MFSDMLTRVQRSMREDRKRAGSSMAAAKVSATIAPTPGRTPARIRSKSSHRRRDDAGRPLAWAAGVRLGSGCALNPLESVLPKLLLCIGLVRAVSVCTNLQYRARPDAGQSSWRGGDAGGDLRPFVDGRAEPGAAA